MSTTAPKPATTPIPVQLSEPEFEAFILHDLAGYGLRRRKRNIRKKPGLFRGHSFRPLQRSLAFASGAGLQKKL